MNLNLITAAMETYANARNSQGLNLMQQWYGQGNMFSFQRDPGNQPIPPDPEAYVHAYPGIHNGQLVFFVISAYLDSPNTVNIENYVQVCPIATGTPTATSTTGNIPVSEALMRIDAWNTGHNAWLQANIAATDSIFQCYIIPQNDTATGNQHNAFLALNSDSGAPGGAIADAIIEDIGSGQLVYMDTVDFIPPMGGSNTKKGKERFHLLDLLP